MDELEHYNDLLAKRNRAQNEGCGDEGRQLQRKSRGRQVGSKNGARTRIDDLPDDTLQALEVADSAPEAEGRGGMGEGVAAEAAVAGGGGAAAESAAGGRGCSAACPACTAANCTEREEHLSRDDAMQ
jgi:hypothetical protein